MKYQLGIIGAGKIGEAILSGVLSQKLYAPSDLILSVRTEQHRQDLERRYGVRAVLANREVAREAALVLLSVKPRSVIETLQEIADLLHEGSVLVSVAAGVPLEAIQSRLAKKVPVVRAMPNLAVSVGEGMTVLTPCRFIDPAALDSVIRLFRTVGRVLVLDEQYMDAVTGLSGSGPAYVYLIIEALADGGVKMGLSREVAIELAAQTVLGAAKTVLVSGEHPAKLKDQVTTPAGVTIDGLMELEDGGLRVTLIKAVVKATERARQLLHK
ncbi:MAG: pyrroline-5-carboxylate reductase [Spirochaetaceae bacterium]|nr:pyrroline-5-carboxylate reductase [Spirochaetaceae bacterium]